MSITSTSGDWSLPVISILRAVKAFFWRVRYPKGRAWRINEMDTIVFSSKIRYVDRLHWPHIWKPLMEEVRENDVVVDCGAGVGGYALGIGKRLGENGTLIAIEPDPKNFELLEENVQLNHFKARVKLHQCALSSEVGPIPFAMNGATSGQTAANDPRAVSVMGVPLDKLVPHGPVDLMTITVQGCELEMLDGAREIFSNPSRRPRMIMIGIEPIVWQAQGKTIHFEQLLQLLESYSYDMREAREFLTLSPDRYLVCLSRGTTDRVS